MTAEVSRSETIIAQLQKNGDALALNRHDQDVPIFQYLALCTVVPDLLPAWREVAAATGLSLSVITGTMKTPLKNAYTTLETLGADRLMAAVGAATLVGTPVIPVSLGTATVVDAVSAEGVYLGGQIAPGVGLLGRMLSQETSALPEADWHSATPAIGRTTTESLAAGAFYAAVGGIAAMVSAVRAELGANTPLAVTGGWGEHLAPHLTGVALMDPFLVLRGIAVVMRQSPDAPVQGT